jgi:hypothetical protein
MIKVEYSLDTGLQVWYVNNLMPLISQYKMKKPVESPLRTIYSSIVAMNDEELIDILIIGKEELTKKYDWIRVYISLCDFVGRYRTYREQIKEQYPGQKRKGVLQRVQ